MNQQWQDFLTQQGAQLQEGIAQHFGNFNNELQSAQEGTVVCDLGQFGCIRVSGEEAQKFLQNLLSNDITAVTDKTAQLSSFNTAKGRMLATFTIFKQGDDYILQLPRSLTAAMHKKLSMYVLRSKVKVNDASDEIICLGVAGKDAAKLIQQYCNATLTQDWTTAQENDLTIVRFSATRYMVATTPASAITLWPKLSASSKAAGSACWDWLNIRAGIPVVTPATQEQFVLQMANLDVLNGVSFKKGCYPGQEIVARTHYLGKQKRRMYLAHVDGDIPPAAGNELYSSNLEGQACGMVINASQAPEGGYDLLAVMQISSYESQDVRLQSAQGAKLQFLQQPYVLPSE